MLLDILKTLYMQKDFVDARKYGTGTRQCKFELIECVLQEKNELKVFHNKNNLNQNLFNLDH